MASKTNFARARDAAAITPADDASLSRAADAIYIGGAGAVKLVTLGGTTVTFSGLPAGSILPVGATKVFDTDTDATLLVALYE